MKTMSEQEIAALEDLVDRVGIAGVTAALSAIALLKAEHVRENWQDERLAELWTRIASTLANAAIARPMRDLAATEGR